MAGHLDLDQGAPATLAADVAIIGAGAAGITVARRLLDSGLSVILLESGGLDYEEATAGLNAGDNVGRPYYELEHARLRLFGGTTAIWGGRCAELDAIDLTRREWVPHSGWPFAIDTLRPYYRQAWRTLGLPEPPSAAKLLNGRLPDFSPEELVIPLWLFDTASDRFSFRRCCDLFTHPRCTIVTHATVKEIVAAPSGRGIERLDVGSLSGRALDVRARTYVLAAGGIETPRLLLCSRSVHRRGLGNHHDQVGRYFMEHPHARGGRILGRSAWAWLAAFQKRRARGLAVAPLIAAAPALQAREGLLNASLTVAGRRPLQGKEALMMRAYLHARHRLAPTQRGRTLWRIAKQTVGRVQTVVDPLRPWLLNKAGKLDVALVVRSEQAPDPDSRVTLCRGRDALGMNRVALDWRIGALDVDSVAGLVAALARESERLGLGRIEPAAWLAEPGREWTTDPLISTHPIGGYHHIGTARMALDPRRGVTDGDGRVHDIGNLYIAGSALFPTSGWANPTLTILALALRTADTIAARASSPIEAATRAPAYASAK